MLKNRIIPCLDVNNGRVVKGINFVDLKDAGDPSSKQSTMTNAEPTKFAFQILQQLTKTEIQLSTQ